MTKSEAYVGELHKNLEILKVTVAVLEKKSEVLGDRHKEINDCVQELGKEIAVLKQQTADHVKRIDEWDRRLWGLVSVLISAILSLAAGLIVALTRH